MRYTRTRAFGRSAVHMFSAAHGVANLARKALLAPGSPIKIGRSSHRNYHHSDHCPTSQTTTHSFSPQSERHSSPFPAHQRERRAQFHCGAFAVYCRSTSTVLSRESAVTCGTTSQSRLAGSNFLACGRYCLRYVASYTSPGRSFHAAFNLAVRLLSMPRNSRSPMWKRESSITSRWYATVPAGSNSAFTFTVARIYPREP